MKAPKPLVCVVWDDAHGLSTGDYTEDEVARDVHKAIRYCAYGMLVKEDDSGVTLASEWSNVDGVTFRGLSFIPKGMVISLERVETKRRGRRTDSAPETDHQRVHGRHRAKVSDRPAGARGEPVGEAGAAGRSDQGSD